MGFHVSTPSILYCENLGAASLAANLVFHARTKHIEIDFHTIRDLMAIGFVQTPYVPTLHKIADPFTKGLPKELFFRLHRQVMHYVSV